MGTSVDRDSTIAWYGALGTRHFTRVLAPLVLVLEVACGGGSDGVEPTPAPPVSPPPGPQVSPDSVLLFDQGHFNLHNPAVTYAAFSQLARGDGWIIRTLTSPFRLDSLRRGRLLVITNALAPQNVMSWRLPTPSAFSGAEIAIIREWVESGGGLLLIADHMPFAGAAEDLAAAFDIRFSNGFAFDTRQLVVPNTCLRQEEVHVFRRMSNTLSAHPITAGVDSVGTFTGSAFEGAVVPLLTFNSTSVSLEPQVAWQFPSGTPRISVAGWYQGAVKQIGRGRIAVFGEAAMFSEQECAPGVPMGMNAPPARQNSQFVLNVLRWLSGRIG